jgi:hypothetical protein
VRTGYWILDTGYWILDTGYWILDTGYWILDTGYWILDTGYWIDLVFYQGVHGQAQDERKWQPSLLHLHSEALGCCLVKG